MPLIAYVSQKEEFVKVKIHIMNSAATRERCLENMQIKRVFVNNNILCKLLIRMILHTVVF